MRSFRFIIQSELATFLRPVHDGVRCCVMAAVRMRRTLVRSLVECHLGLIMRETAAAENFNSIYERSSSNYLLSSDYTFTTHQGRFCSFSHFCLEFLKCSLSYHKVVPLLHFVFETVKSSRTAAHHKTQS